MRTGCYRGVHYAELRYGSVFIASDRKDWFWFILDAETKQPTGSHFGLLEELQRWIDEELTCPSCHGSGRVTIEDQVVVDAHTKWQISAPYPGNIECPKCNGDGFLPAEDCNIQ